MNSNSTTSPRPRLLVADDDRIVLLTIADGLRQMGFDVLTAQDGAAALRICLEESPDLALLDIRMPRLSGIDLARRLTDESTVPFIFLTAYDDRSLIDEAIAAGAFGYLVKPIDVARIVPSVQAALARAGELRKSKEAEQSLAAALVSNRDIAMAVGMLMQRHQVPAEAAFEALRRYARRHQRKVVDIANDVIGGSLQADLGLGVA